MEQHASEYRGIVIVVKDPSKPILDCYLRPDFKDPRFMGSEQVIFGDPSKATTFFLFRQVSRMG